VKIKIILSVFMMLVILSTLAYSQGYWEQQKVKDRERAVYWKKRGYNFNPEYMTAYSMNQ
jgi:hypothetical protein